MNGCHETRRITWYALRAVEYICCYTVWTKYSDKVRKCFVSNERVVTSSPSISYLVAILTLLLISIANARTKVK